MSKIVAGFVQKRVSIPRKSRVDGCPKTAVRKGRQPKSMNMFKAQAVDVVLK